MSDNEATTTAAGNTTDFKVKILSELLYYTHPLVNNDTFLFKSIAQIPLMRG